MSMNNVMSEKKKALIAYKEKIKRELQYYESRIDEFSNTNKSHYFEYSDSSDSESEFPLNVDLGPPVHELKQQQISLKTCLQATQELIGLQVIQSEVNLMVNDPVIEGEPPVLEQGDWREVTVECRVDLIPFSIQFYMHQSSEQFGARRYRGVRAECVRASHAAELSTSVLAAVTTPSDAVEVLKNYAAGHRSRRTTLARLAKKFNDTLHMEPMPEGGYLLKCANLLEVSWTLQNKWSPIAPFHHRMKFDLEYMDESYIKIITQAHRQLSNPTIETDERTLLLSKIISTCLEAQGPTQELYESMSSDPETAQSLKNRRMTLDKEPEAPVLTKNKDREIMAPPKSLPKKTKPKGKENISENAKATRSSEETATKMKKANIDSDNSELSKKKDSKSPNEIPKEKFVNKENSVANLNKDETKTKVSKVDKVNTNNVNKDNAKNKEANSKTNEINTKTKEVNTKTKDASIKTKEANTKIKEASTKTKEAITTMKETNTKTKEANIKTKDTDTKTKEVNTKTKESNAKTKEAMNIGTIEKTKTTLETNTSDNTKAKGTATSKSNKADSGKKLDKNNPNTDNIENTNKETNHEKKPIKANNKENKVQNINLKDKTVTSNPAKTVKKLNPDNKDNAKTKPSKVDIPTSSDKIEKNQAKTVVPNKKQVNNVQDEYIKNKPQTKDDKAKTISSQAKVPNKPLKNNADKENKQTANKIKEKTNNENTVEKVVEQNKNIANLKRKSTLAQIHDKDIDKNVAPAKKPKLSKPEKSVTNIKSDKPKTMESNLKKAQDIKPQNKMTNKLSVNKPKTISNIVKTLKTGNIQRVFSAGNVSRHSLEKASRIPQKKLNTESTLKKNPLRISPRKIPSKFKSATTFGNTYKPIVQKTTSIPRLMKNNSPRM